MRGREIVYTVECAAFESSESPGPRTIRQDALVWVFWYLLQMRRIRLAAYGARLERVLGSRPRGFKSPILRCSKGGSD
jgi:hypothetical protein